MSARYAYYDRDADIAWLGTGESENVLSEEVNWGPDGCSHGPAALDGTHGLRRPLSSGSPLHPARTSPCVRRRLGPAHPQSWTHDRGISHRVDHDASTDAVVALEVWNASKRLPQAVLDALPAPAAPHSAVA